MAHKKTGMLRIIYTVCDKSNGHKIQPHNFGTSLNPKHMNNSHISIDNSIDGFSISFIFVQIVRWFNINGLYAIMSDITVQLHGTLPRPSKQ